jgi:hypothetical protein
MFRIKHFVKTFISTSKIFNYKLLSRIGYFNCKPMLSDYKIISYKLMYNYKLPSMKIHNKLPSRNYKISSYKPSFQVINNAITILLCTFLSGFLICYIVLFTTAEIATYLSLILSILYQIYFIATVNNVYMTLFVYSIAFLIVFILVNSRVV